MVKFLVGKRNESRITNKMPVASVLLIYNWIMMIPGCETVQNLLQFII